jgi:hypothetical protein
LKEQVNTAGPSSTAFLRTRPRLSDILTGI